MSRTLGIVGPGRVGTAIGRLAIAAGWDVLLVGSPNQTSLQLIMDVAVPGAIVTSPEVAAACADVVEWGGRLPGCPCVSRTLGIVGPGRVGTAIGRLAIAAGWDVLLVGSPNQTSLQLIMDVAVPGAIVTSPEVAAACADVTVVAVQFAKAASVRWDLLSGKIVIDAMNAWSLGGRATGALTEPSTSEVHAQLNPDVLLVKSLNQLGHWELEDDSLPPGHPGRRALAYATDHELAKPVVAQLIDDLGFDPVDIGPLAEGRWLEPGHLAFGQDRNATQLRAAVAKSRAQASA